MLDGIVECKSVGNFLLAKIEVFFFAYQQCSMCSVGLTSPEPVKIAGTPKQRAELQTLRDNASVACKEQDELMNGRVRLRPSHAQSELGRRYHNSYAKSHTKIFLVGPCREEKD